MIDKKTCSSHIGRGFKMSRRRKQSLAAVIAILGILAYLQFRTWRDFDWHVFSITIKQLRFSNIVAAVALTYFAYFLRALRWKVFLKPVCDVPVRNLVPAQFVGFTALALLGRPGELVRPYLIANRQGMTVASQLGVLAVERICDLGAFALLLCIGIFTAGSTLPFPHELHRAAIVLGAVVVVMATVAVLIRFKGPIVARWAEATLSTPGTTSWVNNRIEEFGNGLNTFENSASFVQICVVSLAMWFAIALMYRFVLSAYPNPLLQRMGMAQLLLLMGCGMLGSLVQLPGIGGGSQLATIAMLASWRWFAVPKELAVSCSILLWLVGFMAVIPAGLVFARREHVLIRRMGSAA